MKRPARQLYAILREDVYEDLDVRNVIVTAIWTELDKAKAEAARLNDLNGSATTRYWWQTTRTRDPKLLGDRS